MSGPPAYFLRYFIDDLLEQIASRTNIYALQTPGAILRTMPQEIKTFFGMLMIMGTLEFSSIRIYWNPVAQIPGVSEASSVKRFFRLWSAPRVRGAETNDRATNKFWKVQPLLDAVRKGCFGLPATDKNSTHEHTIPFTGRVAKQTLPRRVESVPSVQLLHMSGIYQGKGTGA